MNKHDPLTAQDMADYHLRDALIARIESCRERRHQTPGETRVLDFGCGRGRTVARLMEAGYDACGVDHDPAVLEKAHGYFNERGWEPERRLRPIASTGASAFPDNTFHFVFSEQVFEHVRDLSAVARDLYRITAPGGSGWHVFSAPHRWKEEHLVMPFIHWLPKNRLRHALIYLNVALGRPPIWKQLEGRTTREIARTYYEYSCDKTYYRRWREVRRLFEAAGFTVSFEIPGLSDTAGLHRLLLRAVRRLSWRLYRELALDTLQLRLEVSK